MASRSTAAHVNTNSSSTSQSAVGVGSSVTQSKHKGTTGSASKHSLASFLASPSTRPPYPQPSSVPKTASTIPPVLPSPVPVTLPPMPELERVPYVAPQAPWANAQRPVAVPLGTEEEIPPLTLEPLFDATEGDDEVVIGSPAASSPFTSDTGVQYSSAQLSAMLHEAMRREGKPTDEEQTPFKKVGRREIPAAPMKPSTTFARGPPAYVKKNFTQLSVEQEEKRAADKQKWKSSTPDLRTMSQHSTGPFVPPAPRVEAPSQMAPSQPVLPYIPVYRGQVPRLPVCAPPAPEDGSGHFGAVKTKLNAGIQEYTFQPLFTPKTGNKTLQPQVFDAFSPHVQQMISASGVHFARVCVRSIAKQLPYMSGKAIEFGEEFTKTHPLPDVIVGAWYPSGGDLAFSGSNHILHPKFPGLVNVALKEHLSALGLPQNLYVQVYFNMKFGYSLKFTTLRVPVLRAPVQFQPRPQPMAGPRRLTPPPLPTINYVLPPPLPVENSFAALRSSSPPSGGADE